MPNKAPCLHVPVLIQGPPGSSMLDRLLASIASGEIRDGNRGLAVAIPLMSCTRRAEHPTPMACDPHAAEKLADPLRAPAHLAEVRAAAHYAADRDVTRAVARHSGLPTWLVAFLRRVS
jgi:hypothetical protein